MATNVAQSHRGAMVSMKYLFVIEDSLKAESIDEQTLIFTE
jgi:hypothetical protein